MLFCKNFLGIPLSQNQGRPDSVAPTPSLYSALKRTPSKRSLKWPNANRTNRISPDSKGNNKNNRTRAKNVSKIRARIVRRAKKSGLGARNRKKTKATAKLPVFLN